MSILTAKQSFLIQLQRKNYLFLVNRGNYQQTLNYAILCLLYVYQYSKSVILHKSEILFVNAPTTQDDKYADSKFVNWTIYRNSAISSIEAIVKETVNNFIFFA